MKNNIIKKGTIVMFLIFILTLSIFCASLKAIESEPIKPTSPQLLRGHNFINAWDSNNWNFHIEYNERTGEPNYPKVRYELYKTDSNGVQEKVGDSHRLVRTDRIKDYVFYYVPVSKGDVFRVKAISEEDTSSWSNEVEPKDGTLSVNKPFLQIFKNLPFFSIYKLI